MSGPWEDFQTKGTSSGPWDDFKSDAQKMGKTGTGPVFGEVTKGKEPGVEEGLHLGRRIANLPGELLFNKETFGPGDSLLPAAGLQPLLAPLAKVESYIPTQANIVEGVRQGMNRMFPNVELFQRGPAGAGDEQAKGITQGLYKSVEQVATPENAEIAAGIALAPQAGLSKAAIEALATSYFLPQMAGGLGEQAGRASVVMQDPNASPMEKGSAVGETLGTAGMTALLGRGAMKEAFPEPVKPSGILPTDNISGAKALLNEVNPNIIPPNAVRPNRFAPYQNAIQLPRQAPDINDLKFIPKQFEEAPPLIGQRPVSVEQPVLPPVEAKPGQLQVPELPLGMKNIQLGGQVSYEGQGIPSARQAGAMVPENVLKTPDQLSGKKLYSGLGLSPEDFQSDKIKPEDLRPAIFVEGRKLIGDYGDTHADILLRNGINPDTIPHQDPRRGFVDINNPNEFVARKVAEQRSGIKGTADAGGLDSMDLPGAAMRKLEREGEEPNAIRELRTGSISETQPSRDLQKVEQEVRERTGEQGQAQEGQKGPKYPRAYEGRGIDDAQMFSGSSVSPEDLAKAVRKGLNYASAKIREGAPDFIYRIGKEGGKPVAEEITDQHELGRAIEQAGEKHHWMKPNGEVVQGKAPENTHYLAAKKILGEKVKDVEASDMRETYKKMRDEGYAKVIEQPDAVYVVGSATDKQIQAAKKLADEGKKDLFVKGQRYEEQFIEADEQAGGTLDDGREIDDAFDHPNYDDPNIYPDDPLYSGLGFLNPKSIIPGVKPATKFIDYLIGRSMRRPVRETIDYYLSRTTRRTTPRTVAADEAVANKLVEAGSLDLTTAIQGLSTAAAKTYRDGVLSDLYREYEDAGLGMKPVKGQAPPKGFRATNIARRPIWVRSDLVPEIEQVFNPITRVEDSSAVSFMLDLAVETQIWGGTDFVWHMANMTGSILFSPGKGKSALGDILLNVPGVNAIDFIPRIGKQLRRVIQNDAATRNELVKLSKLGAVRGVTEDAGLFRKIIETFDRAGRLARNEMYDNLIKQGARDTATDRREFVNKMGQYNEKLMSRAQAILRSYFSQFVVAGRTFNYNTLNKLMVSDAPRAVNPEAALKFRMVQLVNLFTALAAAPIAANMMITKTPFGRPGTDPGAIDSGKDGPDGRPIQFDPLQLMGIRRGLRMGPQQVYRGIVKGDKPIKIAGDAVKALAVGLLHPWMGPPGRVIYTYFSGKDISGYKVSNDGDDNVENFKAALAQVNPLASAYLEGKKSGVGGGRNILERTGAAFGYKKGAYPTHDKLLEKEQGKSVDEMDLGERILAEESHSEKVDAERKLKPPGLRQAEEVQAGQKALKNIIKRGRELQDELPKGDKQWLESRGLVLPGYDNKITLAKQKVYLTEDEMARYTEIVKDNVSDAISALRDVYDDLPDEKEKAEVYSELMTAARKVAREQLETEMAEKSVPKKKRKRFSIFQSAPEEGVREN